MGTVYSQLGETEGAWRSYREAVKHNRTSWKIWQNYILLSLRMRKFSYCILGLRQLLAIGASDKIDHDILAVIIEEICGNPIMLETEERATVDQSSGSSSAVQGEEGKNDELRQQQQERLGELMEELVASTNSSEVWAMRARFDHLRGDLDGEVESRGKELRAVQVAGWELQLDTFQRVCFTTMKLVPAVAKQGDKKTMYSTKLALRKIIKMAGERFPDSKEVADLQEILKTLS